MCKFLDPRVNDQVARWKVVNGKYLNLMPYLKAPNLGFMFICVSVETSY